MLSWLTQTRGGRTVGILFVAAAFLLGVAAGPAAAQGDKRVVKVMTYNMDAGTDFLYFLASPDNPLEAAAATYQELLQTDFPGRVGLIADQIAAAKPDLVSLQEVTLWEVFGSKGKKYVLADMLDLLRQALRSRQQEYRVVGVQELSDLAAPVDVTTYLHFLDRNVILARLAPGAPEPVSNVRMGVYQARSEPIPGFAEINGWMSVDVKAAKGKFRFFATHLAASPEASDPLQPAQGAELLEQMNASPYPVVLAGDFNSDMSGLAVTYYPPDATPTAPNIAAAGYDDAWITVGHQPWDGLTWPFYWEDIFADVNPDGMPVERIDLIFVKGVTVMSAETLGTTSPYPSDHAGVIATLQVEK